MESAPKKVLPTETCHASDCTLPRSAAVPADPVEVEWLELVSSGFRYAHTHAPILQPRGSGGGRGPLFAACQ